MPHADGLVDFISGVGVALTGSLLHPRAETYAAITVNRWAHGYAYGYDPVEGTLTFRPNGWPMNEWPEEKCNWMVGRKRFGRISIANADSAAWAMAEASIGEAHRAVQEVLGQAD